MKNSIESTLLLLGAAGLGAGLMFTLDPEQGRRRREALASTAEQLLSTGGEVLGATAESASGTARSVAHKIGGYAHRLADNLSESAHDAVDTAGRGARDVKDRAGALWTRARRSTGMEPESHPLVLASEITAASVGLLGLGAGLMYMLDPAKGRARRAWMRDKVVSITRHTGREARQYGRHLGNRMKGVMAEARRSTPWQSEQPSMPTTSGI